MEYSIEELLDAEMIVAVGPDPDWLKQRRRELAALRAIATAARAVRDSWPVALTPVRVALADALDALDKEK